jgi:aspartate aminotransferase-like enzyme
LKPWKNAHEIKYFPYTPNWRAIAALDLMLDKILEEGEQKVTRNQSR